MVMYVKWQDVRCGVNLELSVCGQVIRRGRKVGVRSGLGGTLSERKKDTVCLHTNNQKHTGPV